LLDLLREAEPQAKPPTVYRALDFLLITASAGNHAQGVAFSSARLGVKALIVMPTATADIKVDAVRGFGGEVLLHGANFDEAKAKAIELSQQQGFTWVPPFDHPMVIAGQ
ncbi:pyridoxal-phosphate dependent enzyme, partial [Klebsiella pneumoniae]